MKRLLLLLGALAVAGCNLDTTSTNSTPSDPATESFATSLGINISQMQKVAVGTEFVYFRDITVGQGATLTTPGEVVVSYEGFLSNGFRFDAGSSVPFNLSGTVIGFQRGMIGMNVGGERIIVIPSDLGYGPYGYGTVPPNSTLVFHVKLEQLP